MFLRSGSPRAWRRKKIFHISADAKNVPANKKIHKTICGILKTDSKNMLKIKEMQK